MSESDAEIGNANKSHSSNPESSDAFDLWNDDWRNLYRQRAIISMNNQTLGTDDWNWVLEQRDWYKIASPEEKNGFVAQQLQSMCVDEHRIDTRVFTLLAVLYSIDKEPFWKSDFQRYIEDLEPNSDLGLNHNQTASMIGYIGQLEQQSNSEYHLFQLHVVLDYIADAMQSLQKDEGDFERENPGYYPSIQTFQTLAETAEHYSEHSTNYLVSRKFRDIFELSRQESLDKPDALYGVEGGSTDASIYAFKNTLKNYDLRTRYGFYEGCANRNPLLPIAPGFFVMYDRNDVSRVFEISPRVEDQSGYVRSRIAQAGTGRYEALCEKLNIPKDEWSRMHPRHHPNTVGLTKLQDIWDFKEGLDDTEEGFLCDLDRIDPKALHPFVLGTLVHENVETLKNGSEACDVQINEVGEVELLTRLYPEGASPEQAYHWKTLASLSIRKKIEDDFGVDIAEYPLWIQRSFLELINRAETEQAPDIKEFLDSSSQNSRLITLTAAQWNPEVMSAILNRDDIGQVQPVLDAYARVATSAEQTARELCAEYKRIDPVSALASPQLFVGLVARASALLLQELKSDGDREEVLLSLEKENALVSVSATFFLSLTSALEENESVDLSAFSETQNLVLHAFEEADAKPALLKALHAKVLLTPIPEIFWRVDRSAEEYNARYGFDVKAFLQKFATPDTPQVLVEFGPGNGTFKEDRAGEVKGYVDYAMCDKLYYPINTLIRRLIDFEKLEQNCGELSEQDRTLLCDFIYKVIVINEGQSGQDEFEYDEEIMKALNDDPQTIFECLIKKAHLLEATNVVPNSGNAFDKGVEYEAKVEKPDNPAFREACRLLSQNGAIDEFAPSEGTDVYEHLPAYPPGTIVSDFSKVERLADNQIGVALGVRSTVYKEGDDYRKFMAEMTKKLTQDGFYIDDNVRENFGWNYRLKELKQVQNETGYPLRVILGPGMQKEDFDDEKPVPLAVVVTQSEEKLRWVESNLDEGYSIVELDEVISRTDYIKSLADGRTHDSLQELAA
jgi:hypothetical protein